MSLKIVRFRDWNEVAMLQSESISYKKGIRRGDKMVVRVGWLILQYIVNIANIVRWSSNSLPKIGTEARMSHMVFDLNM